MTRHEQALPEPIDVNVVEFFHPKYKLKELKAGEAFLTIAGKETITKIIEESQLPIDDFNICECTVFQNINAEIAGKLLVVHRIR